MTPQQQTAQHIATLVAGIDLKLNELAYLLPSNAQDALDRAHDALTTVLRETRAAVGERP